MKRAGNNPKRRIAPADSLTVAQRTALTKKVAYVASGHHKRNPADYGLERTNPRPTKSLCDRIRIIPLKEAESMIARGISFGMVSDYAFGEFPKFIWCVSDDDVYEAKTDETTPGTYHGYRLEEGLERTMPTSWSISAEWESLDSGSPEERACFAALSIQAHEMWLTEGLDLLANSVRKAPRLSAYHLSEWIVWTGGVSDGNRDRRSYAIGPPLIG